MNVFSVNDLRLAVLITCHNRRAKTLDCLQALQNQDLPSNLTIQIYLVDDGSTDGTGESVQAQYHNVKVIQGDGTLFWNGGMRCAFAEAFKQDYDYYLWLNDDTLLYPSAITTMVSTACNLAEQGHTLALVVGSVQDSETNEYSYGGVARGSRWHPLKFVPVYPDTTPKPCLTVNGNCVLKSRAVVEAIGNLDPAFSHSTGDVDYGLRLQQQGGSVWVAPGYVGTCEYNPLRHQAWDMPGLTLRERWQKINQPKGLPVKEWRVFSQRHAGPFWRAYWLLPYLRLLLKVLPNP